MLSGPRIVPSGSAGSADMSASAVGYIDALEEHRIAGWAWCRSQPESPVEVEIRLDEVVLKRVIADSFRPDLARAGAGNGKHAFNVILESPLLPSQRERLTAFIVCGENGPFVPLINRTSKEADKVTSGESNGAPPAKPILNFRPVLSALAGVQKKVDDRMSVLGAELRVEIQNGAQASRDQLGDLTSSMDILQTRVDALCAALQERSSAIRASQASDRTLAIIVAILGVVSCASLVLGLISVLR